MNLNNYIDHTLLKATATADDIKKICEEAKENKFCAVCINPCYVKLVKNMLNDTDIKVCTVIGFPLGQNTTETKVFEAKNAVENGADEIDMVINVGAVLLGDYDYVSKEIALVREITHDRILKVIIETCYLSCEQIKKMTQICIENNADFVKTSTGFGIRGASLQDIETIAEVAHDAIKIKASGGIKTKDFATQLINAGAQRIGTSSGVALISKE